METANLLSPPANSRGQGRPSKVEKVIGRPRNDTQSSPTWSSQPPEKRSRRRPWEERIDHQQEIITKCSIISNGFRPCFVGFSRVLLSHRLAFSYIYHDVVNALGFNVETIKPHQYVTPFGLLEPIGFACIHVCMATAGDNFDPPEPFLVDFLVLSGHAPPEGVSIMLGTKHIPSDLHNPSAFHMTMPPPIPEREAVKSILLSSNAVSPPLFMVTAEFDETCTAPDNHGDSTSTAFGPDGHDPNNHSRPIPVDPELSALAGAPAPAHATEESGSLPPVSWKSGFSWHSQHLMLDGEEIPTGQPHAAAPVDMELDRESSAAVGGSGTRNSSASDLTAKERVLTGSEALPLQGLDKKCLVAGTAERRDFLVSLLEQHYWRTHPPLRPGRQNGPNGRHSAIATAGRSSRPSRNQGPRKKGKGIDHGSGGGDEEADEGERDGDGTPSGTARSEPTNDYFACPFLKWRPRPYYDICGGRFRTISHLNEHLRLEHYNKQCTRCHRTFGSAEEKHQHLQQTCAERGGLLTRPGVISEEHWVQIFERPKRKSKFESSDPVERWYSTFGILFPDHPKPRSPYMQGKDYELLGGLVAYAEREARQELRRLQDQFPPQGDGPSGHRSPDEETSNILDALVVRLFEQVVEGFMAETGADNGIGTTSSVPLGEPSTSQDHGVRDSTTPSPVSTPRASQPFIATPHPQPAESPYQSEDPSRVTSPTSIGLTTGSSITEILYEAGESVEEDFMDLDWHETMEYEQLPQHLDDAILRHDDSTGLMGFGAWDEAPFTVLSSNDNKHRDSTNWGLTPMDPDVNNHDNHSRAQHVPPTTFHAPSLDPYLNQERPGPLDALSESTFDLLTGPGGSTIINGGPDPVPNAGPDLGKWMSFSDYDMF